MVQNARNNVSKYPLISVRLCNDYLCEHTSQLHAIRGIENKSSAVEGRIRKFERVEAQILRFTAVHNKWTPHIVQITLDNTYIHVISRLVCGSAEIRVHAICETQSTLKVARYITPSNRTNAVQMLFVGAAGGRPGIARAWLW